MRSHQIFTLLTSHRYDSKQEIVTWTVVYLTERELNLAIENLIAGLADERALLNPLLQKIAVVSTLIFLFLSQFELGCFSGDDNKQLFIMRVASLPIKISYNVYIF